MTDEELNSLEQMAAAATPGHWENDSPTWANPWDVGIRHGEDFLRTSICTLDVKYGNTDQAPRALNEHYLQVIDDAKYIAAARPETVLKLIEEIRRLRRLGPKDVS